MAVLGDSSYPGGDGDDIDNFGSLLRSQATENGTITAIENNVRLKGALGTYRAVIYRGTASNPTTLAYYSGSDIITAVDGVLTHTLSSSISMTSGEYLWHGIRTVTDIGLCYGGSSGARGADVSPFNHPVPDPCTGYTVFDDTRYASALVYTPAGSDTTPDSFSFTDITGATISTVYTSNTITVSGIDAAAAISISGGSGTYSINGGSYTASSGTVNNGDTVAVRVTSSGSYSTAVSTTLTIGGVSDTYSVTTGTAVTVDSYPSTIRSGSTGNSFTTTGLSNVTSITIGSKAATSISESGGDGTHSFPNLSDGVAYELYGSGKTVTITGTGGAPTTTTQLLPLSTQSYVTLSGTLNTTNTGVLYNFSPAAAVGDQIVWDTDKGTVDAQGNITTDYVGTQTMWHIDATDNVARSYDVITGTAQRLKYWNGSAWVAKPLKYWNGSAWVEKTIKYWNGSAWI